MRKYLGDQVRASPFRLELARKIRHPRTVYKHQIPNHKLLFCTFLIIILFHLFFVGYGGYRLELTTLPHRHTNVEGHFFIVQPKFHLPFSISFTTLPVARNGLPIIIGTSKSTSQSRITKSAGNMNDSTFTNTLWSIPIGLFTFDQPSLAVSQWVLGHPNPTSCKSRGA